MKALIENSPDDPNATRCGHNFPAKECPYRHCGYKDLLQITGQQTSDDSWIAWNGGERPVDGETRVEVRFRNNSRDANVARGYRWNWENMSKHVDIIAYRVIKEGEKP